MGERTVATIASPMLYAPETFTDSEADRLRPYFTNLDGPVFALTNLPEVVKGALFARYSRSDKSLRRLFLDEFVGDLDLTGDLTVDATVGLKRAEDLYERVFLEYGDDSVAQLGGVHLACEQASNLLTKILEWGRLMAYLEQSTRYIPYDSRLQGRYRYLRPSQVCSSPMGTRYVADLDALFDTYSAALDPMMQWARERYPKEPSDSDFVYKQTIKAKACDSLRGLLPAATLSNVGIYGTGQAFEALLLRMRSHPLPEAQMYAQLMLDELRKVIPSFLVRVDRPERGGAWSQYLSDTRDDTHSLVQRFFGSERPEPTTEVSLSDWDPDGEDKVLAAICYSHTRLPEAQLLERVRLLSAVRSRRVDAGVRRGACESSPQARPRVRAHRLPLRRVGRLRRVPRPAAASHVDDRVAAAHAASRIRDAGTVAGSRTRAPLRRGDGTFRRTLCRARRTVPGTGRVRGFTWLSHALRHADERARSNAPVRAEKFSARSPDVSPRRAGDASSDRRARGTSRDRRSDAIRRPRNVRSGAVGRGARG